MFTRMSVWWIPGLILFLAAGSLSAQAQSRRKIYLPGQRAVIVDERLSVLRSQPNVKATIVQRLRRGRVIGVLATKKGKDGETFWRVAVTRNTRGWVLAESAVKSGNPADAERLIKLMDESDDDFIQARLSRLCADEFRSTVVAPRCLLKLGEAAERAAERLTRDAKRRVGDQEPSAGLSKRDYFLNFAGLDRYNRIGVMFDFDLAAEKIVYDGLAYSDLQRRYPKSAEAQTLNARIGNR